VRCGAQPSGSQLLPFVKTAIVSACIMFGIAILISMAVAALMKVIFLTIRRINAPKKG
jgi:hypothetical protein